MLWSISCSPRFTTLADDEETPETVLWRQTVERLLASGSSAVEALDGANLILQAYRRQHVTLTVPTPEVENPPGASTTPAPEEENPLRSSGVRRKSKSGKYSAK